MNLNLFLFNEKQYVVAATIEQAIKAYINNFPNADKVSVQLSISSIQKISIVHSVIVDPITTILINL